MNHDQLDKVLFRCRQKVCNRKDSSYDDTTKSFKYNLVSISFKLYSKVIHYEIENVLLLYRLGPSSRQNDKVTAASSSKNSVTKASHHKLSLSYVTGEDTRFRSCYHLLVKLLFNVTIRTHP